VWRPRRVEGVAGPLRARQTLSSSWVQNKNGAKNPAGPVGSSGVFSILSYPDSFIAFQRH